MSLKQETLGFLISDLARIMRKAFVKRLEGSSLTLAQARALVYLSRHEGVRQVELAELLEIQPITLARLLDQLAEAGVVERRADPSDRRAYLVFLTRRAAPHLAAIERVAGEIRADAMQGLDERSTALVFKALSRMRQNLTPH